LDKEYSLERRKEITSLEIFDKGLEGELIIKDFDNLNYLKCSDNPITSLTIENLPNLDILITSRCDITSIVVNNCPKLRVFNVNNNFLTNFNFNSLNPDSLTILDIAHNNFPPQTLEFLTSFVKLERAYIGANNKKRLDKDIFNRFYGSLKPLEKLKSLEYLVIDSTDIDNGLEYLSKSFKKISCKSKREEAHCLKIKKELEEVSQKEGVNEKLQEVLEGEPE
jgi:Leucine-rich repeat (LRR) protein